MKFIHSISPMNPKRHEQITSVILTRQVEVYPLLVDRLIPIRPAIPPERIHRIIKSVIMLFSPSVHMQLKCLR